MSYDSHISTMLSSLYEAIEEGRGWSLVRLGDGEIKVLTEQLAVPMSYLDGGGIADPRSLEWLRENSLTAIKEADWVGWFAYHANDQAALDGLGVRPATERSQHAFVNLHMALRREFVERVLREASLFLVGKPVRAWYTQVLKPRGLGQQAHFYEGNCNPAIWEQALSIVSAAEQSGAQVVLASLGFWAVPICGELKRRGIVAIDYGHAPCHMMADSTMPYLLNDCCDATPEGTMHHYAHARPPQCLPEVLA